MIADMRATAVLVLLVSVMVAQSVRNGAGSPNDWEDRDQYLALEEGPVPGILPGLLPKPELQSGKAMIAGASNPFAVHAGLEVLKRGGSAADAVLTTALTQIALNAGATVSYAGILTAVYYDVKSGKVYSLNASWNRPRNETDPLSIPSQGTASGRSALVPGFMAGVQALHERFGRRPFAELFEPAIWLAEHGFPLPRVVAAWRHSQATSIERLEETRRVFQKEDGSYYNDGDNFRQPELAGTLRQIANQGATYFYEREWAHHFVDAVRREGGKVTLEDLGSYRVVWSEPTRAIYHGFEVTSLGAPSLGGSETLSGLLLWEHANMSKRGDYSHSADALYALIQIAKLEASLSLNSEDDLRKVFPGLDLSASARLSPATTNRLATILRNKNWFTNLLRGKPALPPNHSSSVVAVDDQGNVAALLHSCNCGLWGTTGLFVDGISIPDPAAFQQAAVARTEPGGRLPDSTNPVIVLKDNRPVLASSAVGSGLQEVTLQNLINVLDLGLDPQAAVNRPNFLGPFLGITTNGSPKPELTEEVLDRGFPPSVVKGLKRRGQDVYAGLDGGAQSGYWIGIQIDPKGKALWGGATRRLNSFVEGY